jgi:hypothetical protein
MTQCFRIDHHQGRESRANPFPVNGRMTSWGQGGWEVSGKRASAIGTVPCEEQEVSTSESPKGVHEHVHGSGNCTGHSKLATKKSPLGPARRRPLYFNALRDEKGAIQTYYKNLIGQTFVQVADGSPEFGRGMKPIRPLPGIRGCKG